MFRYVRGGTRPNRIVNKSPLAHKVEVDACASLLKGFLKHCPGLEVVGYGRKAAFLPGVLESEPTASFAVGVIWNHVELMLAS